MKYRDKQDLATLPPFPQPLLQKFVALKRQTVNVKPLKFLELVYQFMDEYNKFVAEFSVCQKGCSHCCRIPVEVSALEAQYIANKYNIAANSIPVDGKDIHACPFLKKNVCRIYDARPFNCRSFHTLDNPKYCATNEDHQVYGSAGFNYGSDLLIEIAYAIKMMNRNERSSMDIRDLFSSKI